MPAIVEDKEFIALDNSSPSSAWTAIFIAVMMRLFDAAQEYRFLVSCKTGWRNAKLRVDVRCDDAEEWHDLGITSWSPNAVLESPLFPRKTLIEVRYRVFCEIAAVEAQLTKLYTEACLRTVDDGVSYSMPRTQRDLGEALRTLHEGYGRATLVRRIQAAIRAADEPLTADAICDAVLLQPGAPRGEDGREEVMVEIFAMTARESEDSLLESKSRASVLNPDSITLYDLAYVPGTAEQIESARLAAEKAALVEEAKEAEAAEVAKASVDVPGLVVGAATSPLAPVRWGVMESGFQPAECGEGALLVHGSISTGADGGSVYATANGTTTAHDNEELARKVVDERLRAEYLALVAKASAAPGSTAVES